MNLIDVPEKVRALTVVASVSGGKDSTALMLALREVDVPFVAVFADTGWEAPETYAYLDLLREKIGPIDVVRPARDMAASIRHRAGFPGRLQRWCTRELKIVPLRAYHDALEAAGAETISVMGVRAEESAARAKMEELSDDEEWGGYVWRPLLSWSVEDVLAIHHRHGVPVNPLYLRGHDRVGCYPCIFSRKEEIRLISENSPERISQIAALETECDQLRVERNAEKPGRYSYPVSSFFQSREPGGGFAPMRVGQVVEWSRTSRGGRQLELLPPVPTGGCMRWGMCEAPSKEKP